MIVRQEQHPSNQIPQQLKELNKWMGTRYEERKDGKLDKPPYRVRPGEQVIKADKTDPENWATYEEACAALSRGDVDAIGFVFSAEDPLCVIDLDECLDPETGEISAFAAGIVADFEDTYAETSISGTGVHVVGEASKPGPRCSRKTEGKKVEIYDGRSGARFMILTGHRLSRRVDVFPCQEQVDALYLRLFGEEAKKSSPTMRTKVTEPLDHQELLKRARNSRTGAHFRKLYDRGDRTGYDSPNEADYALINTLIFWCAGDGDMVEELFRESALYRPPPGKHKGYVGISVRNALASYEGSYYKPKALREESTPKQRDVLTPYLALLLDATRWKGQKYATAYKAYAALVIMSVEDGIKTDANELHVDADVRSLAERAGANRVTLCRSSLPLLVKEKLLTWQRGRGNKRGTFILRRPQVPSEATIKVSTQYFNGSTYGDGLDALSKLIRMRSGISKTGKVAHLGAMQTVARLGMLAMFCMVTMTTAPRGLKIDELVERTGRRKDHIRTAMHKLVKAEILEESREDCFTCAPAFWTAYQKALISSGIVASERRQRQQHQEERRKNELKLKAGRAQKFEQNVINLDAERRRKLDEAARREQPVDDRRRRDRQAPPAEAAPAPPPRRASYKSTWEDRDWLEPEEEVIQDEYDRMCERVQARLAGETRGAVS